MERSKHASWRLANGRSSRLCVSRSLRSLDGLDEVCRKKEIIAHLHHNGKTAESCARFSHSLYNVNNGPNK